MVLFLVLTKPYSWTMVPSFRKFDLETPLFIAKNIFPQFCKNMTSYIHDVNKIRSHGNIVLFSKDAEYVNIQSGKVSDVSCKTRNHPQTAKPLGSQANHPQTSHIQDKSPTNQPIMRRKSVFYVTRNFSDIAKHVLSLQPFYVIALRFSNEDQSQVGIEGKWHDIS